MAVIWLDDPHDKDVPEIQQLTLPTGRQTFDHSKWKPSLGNFCPCCAFRHGAEIRMARIHVESHIRYSCPHCHYECREVQKEFK